MIPFVEYAFNYNYISTVLCVNKDKPKMQCNGKCHLAKMIAETSDDTTQDGVPTARLDVVFIPLYFQEVTVIHFSTAIHQSVKNKILSYTKNTYACSFIDNLFKPPIWV